jgi:hypothetical protein
LEKFLRAGSVLNVHKRGKRVLAEATLDDIGAQWKRTIGTFCTDWLFIVQSQNPQITGKRF